jgi:hypothetical protein
VEATSPAPQPILIDYSPFICQTGRPCAGCLDYHERKRKAKEEAAVAVGEASKKSRSGSETSSSEDPISEDGEDDAPEDAEEDDKASEDNSSDSSPITPVRVLYSHPCVLLSCNSWSPRIWVRVWNC